MKKKHWLADFPGKYAYLISEVLPSFDSYAFYDENQKDNADEGDEKVHRRHNLVEPKRRKQQNHKKNK